jgi:2-hydroxychromene-2-carboxylate isomerase
MPPRTLTLYIDYKSPYAYLAKEPAYRLERETGVTIDWLPYILDIPAYLGSAKVDAEGRVLEQDRSAHQWRRVKYSYRDVRREANRVGLTIRGTRKIWNSSLAGIGLLYAKRHGAFRAYNDEVFERFWKHDLDIEEPAALADVLKRAVCRRGRLSRFLAERDGPRSEGGSGHCRGQRRVRRAELPLPRWRLVLGTRASAAPSRNPGGVARPGASLVRVDPGSSSPAGRIDRQQN